MKKLFAEQQDDEQVLYIFREYWIALVIKIFVWIFLWIPVVAVWYVVPHFFDHFALPLAVDAFMYLYLAFLVLFLFIILILHYLNVYIITDQRIIDIDQHGLFSRVVSELNIEKMEDASASVSGILGTLLNYGNVTIQTAGTSAMFEFARVKNPDKIVKIILDLYEKNSSSSIGRV